MPARSDYSTIDAVPVTKAHLPPQDLDKVIENPGKPRANYTVDREHPTVNDIGYTPPADMSVLQMHIKFWDPQDRGYLTPLDTYKGFRKLGFNQLISFVAMPVIHGTFSYWSGESWLPDPQFRVFFKNVHRTKHGSDSETYDTEGRFVPDKFESVFSKYDKDNKGGLTLHECWEMIRGNRNIMDPTGWIAEWLEWMVSYYLAAKETPRGKILTKEDARSIVDGTYFYQVAKDIEEGRLVRTSMFKAGLDPVKPGTVTGKGRKQPLSELTRKEQ